MRKLFCGGIALLAVVGPSIDAGIAHGATAIAATAQDDGAEAAPSTSTAPEEENFTADALQAVRTQIIGRYGGRYRDVPLDVKSEFFEWQMWRYHQAPTHQVYNRVRLPSAVGQPPAWIPGSDTSTWNGALLAALSYKYAVTKDPHTLQRIAEILDGLHLFLIVTSQPGLLARSIALDDATREAEMQPYTMPDDSQIYFRSDAAKGTYNQVIMGYATMMMHAYDDLPAATQRQAHDDLTSMVLHVVNHDYHLTERSGQRTRYGDLTPLLGSISVPFNAQVAYQIIATGRFYPPDDPQARARVEQEFRRLRYDHHVYYQRPLLHLVQPQRIGASPFLKGMNDRNHVTNAAFVALALERHIARRTGNPLDPEFFYQLGRTMFWSMRALEPLNNSLCNFMWAGILSDPDVFAVMIPSRGESVRAQVGRVLVRGVEQLRRFKLDRFVYYGQEHISPVPQWADSYRPDEYYWKANPHAVWEVTGAATNDMFCAIDYLHAYWLLRYYHLQTHPALAQHQDVLKPTPGLVFGSVATKPPLRRASTVASRPPTFK